MKEEEVSTEEEDGRMDELKPGLKLMTQRGNGGRNKMWEGEDRVL